MWAHGDMKIQIPQFLDLTPYALRRDRLSPVSRVPITFLFLRGVPHPTLPRGVLHRIAMGMSPVSRALNAARLRLAKFQFSEFLEVPKLEFVGLKARGI